MKASHRQTRPGPPVKLERGEDEVERLTRENEKLRRELIERDKIADAEKQIADLERKLGLAATELHDIIQAAVFRWNGGPAADSGRGLAPLSRVDQVIELFPPQCRHCECRLSRRMSTQDEPRRHQVTELPPMQAHITEYQCHSVICPGCGKATQAALPQEAQGQFGPQLTALIAYLTVVCRLPRRMVRELLEQVLAIPLSLGSIQNSWEEVSEAVAEPCTELERQLPSEAVVNSDETGYRTNGEKRWLWALVAANFVFYKIALTRGAEVLVELLGEVYAGILCSDRCASYLKYHKGDGQFCWAHCKRNILGVQEIGKTTGAERFCRDALALHARLFRLWHRFRDGPGVRYGPITRDQLIAKSIPLEKKFFAWALLQHFERFFAFLRQRRGADQ